MRMRKTEEKRPGGGKRVRFDKDAPSVEKVVVTEKKRGGVKRVHFDTTADVQATPAPKPDAKGGKP